MCWPGPRRHRKTSCSTSSTPPTAATLVRELTDTPGHYSFAHALIQHTLYEDLGSTRRARAHRQVAEALEDLCGDRPGSRVGELARHWFSASQPVDLAKALDYSRQAADAALEALAPADALRYYTQALDLHAQTDDPDPIVGIDLAIGLGTAQRQTGDPAFRETLLDAARRAADLGDTERLVAAALANNRGIFSAGGIIDTDKVELLELALDRLATDDPSRALVLATLCVELAYGSPLERRQALADEALAIAESSGDDATIVRVLNVVAFPLRVPHCSNSRWPARPTPCVRAERVGDPVLLFWAAGARVGAALRAVDIDEMDRCLEIMGSLAEQLDQPILNWVHSHALCPASPDRRGHRTGRTLRHRGTPDRHRQRPTRRHALLRRAARGGELPTRNLRRVGPSSSSRWPRTLPRSPERSLRGWLLSHVEAGRIDDARRLLDEFAAADFDASARPELAPRDDPSMPRRHRVPRPEACRAAVRTARAVGRPAAQRRPHRRKPGEPLPGRPRHRPRPL